ncbi:hypothetical protein QP759_07350 [Actinomycetaceae bacterium UMB8039B]|uniref:hypothetical protein n=1 Tax=unclassified Pauljensenia TaxID=2908895 RepID=UPI00254D7D0B|nr:MULTISPECIES: hypothetical protein [unclassified Pauljensenia]MDK7781393.1 hypothetical protein [Actinomycetaceae bacterium UMB8041B]MDK8294323.1 hypothetical protein [Actinomycetaceae bacterium UMB8039B]MDK8300308.1 hypothetical protein [Actinomycetaceae bacterium UMB1218B]MDK8609150.1 hypothetical protein [Actinomycetaceae bacterium UMB8041A]MDK8753629.1 hypothetical protein [Actinomycetaceae bacterium UMB8039A]
MILITISVRPTVVVGIVPSRKPRVKIPSRLCEASHLARRRGAVGSFTLAVSEFVHGQRDT